MTSTKSLVLLVVFALGACTGEERCEERALGARREAVIAAKACEWRPESLATPACSVGDQRPLHAWVATWCGLASVSCLRASPEAWEVCFGGPDTDEPSESDDRSESGVSQEQGP